MNPADEVFSRLETTGVVAVIVLDRAEDAVPLARALVDGGVDAMELTLRTPAALEGLVNIKREIPEMLAGIGTLLRADQVREASTAGADFGVSPGVNPRVIEEARSGGLPFAPGVVTPSDIEQALEFECRVMKFFPAEPSGGLPYLRSMASPYVHLGLRFLPLGGLGPHNMTTYLEDELVLALGGSWLAPRETVKNQDWKAIEKTARAARERIERLK